MSVPGATREWAWFDDPNEYRRWHVDVTFLASTWECIFGRGCQGVLTEPTPELGHGCCSYGAHFSDRKDRERTERAAKQLSTDEWQFAKEGRNKGVVARVGKSWRTRLVDDACIFLNRPGFKAGAGCALHLHALNTGKHFIETKPEVCWQVPIRRVDDDPDADGLVVSTLGEWGRDGWGEGGLDFAWWCTEAPEAFGARQPVYRSCEVELREMMSDDVFEAVANYLDARLRTPDGVVRHPAQAVTFVARPTRSHAAARSRRA